MTRTGLEVVGGLPAEEIGRRVKAELRDRMRRVRKAIGDAGRAQRSAAIADRVQALTEWRAASVVALFVPMRTEVDVTLLERAARAEGKTVLAPRMIEVERPGAPPSLALELRVWEEGVEPTESGRMVREPPASAPRAALDAAELVIVPALAVDPTGARVGYGAGLYDGLLPRLPRARRVAVAFDFQLVAELPVAPHDVRVHRVVTDERDLGPLAP